MAHEVPLQRKVWRPDGESVSILVLPRKRPEFEGGVRSNPRPHCRRHRHQDRVPGAWCRSVASSVVAGVGRVGQVATAGSMTVGSSFKGAMVSRVM